ncbi:MAG: phage shock protein C [Flavobacterium sp.]|jgi:phage shock protein C
MNRYSFKRSIEDRELKRDSKRKKIAGVCAGIARYLQIPRLAVRIVAVIGLLTMPQPMLIAYGLAYLILDDDRSPDRSHRRYYDA